MSQAHKLTLLQDTGLINHLFSEHLRGLVTRRWRCPGVNFDVVQEWLEYKMKSCATVVSVI